MREYKIPSKPTVKALLTITSRLQEKFKNPSFASIEVWNFRDGSSQMFYNLYIEHMLNEHFKSWQELTTCYGGLLNE